MNLPWSPGHRLERWGRGGALSQVRPQVGGVVPGEASGGCLPRGTAPWPGPFLQVQSTPSCPPADQSCTPWRPSSPVRHRLWVFSFNPHGGLWGRGLWVPPVHRGEKQRRSYPREGGGARSEPGPQTPGCLLWALLPQHHTDVPFGKMAAAGAAPGDGAEASAMEVAPPQPRERNHTGRGRTAPGDEGDAERHRACGEPASPARPGLLSTHLSRAGRAASVLKLGPWETVCFTEKAPLQGPAWAAPRARGCGSGPAPGSRGQQLPAGTARWCRSSLLLQGREPAS